ncbi:uncharacterized protein LOC131148135 [Malania oleifera]|uniref:uncharacterized protein LOC131148135 n=1 Tax=Malania oleifera TaxID=397392 RepID=UPI0025AEBBD6|nr:uncharacterized protein LOC131148135 [Malania oleifera]
MEKMLVVSNCTEEQKVLFTTFKLVRETERWWHAMKLLEEQRTVPIAMTWGRFKQEEEFFNLTQGRLTIQQYAAKFLELSRFAPSMVSDEYQKARWFESGLNKRIHEHMVCLQIQDFAKLVEKTTVAKSSLQRGADVLKRRRRPMSPCSQTNVRQGS